MGDDIEDYYKICYDSKRCEKWVDDDFIPEDNNEELIKKTSSEWLKIFDDNGLPCGPINSITEMFKDPQTIEREMVIEVDNKKAGKSTAIGMPIKFSKSKTEKSKGAPNLGEHTKEVMQIFGYKDDQIEDFYNRKVIL